MGRVKNSRPAKDAGLNALQYLQTEITDKTIAFMAADPSTSNVLLTGDLNSVLTTAERGGSSHPPLQKWLDETGFADPIGTHLTNTGTQLNTCGANGDLISRIDHALGILSNVVHVTYGTSTSPAWADITDHVPLLAGLHVPITQAGHMGYHPKGHIHSLNAKALKDGDDIERFQYAVKEMVQELGNIPADPTKQGYQLELLCRRSAKIVNTQHPPPNRRAHKQHWSVVMLALKAHHIFLGTVRGALRRTRHMGMTADVCKQINKYAQDWESAVGGLKVEYPDHV